ncbi:SRPBCC family protein [uncultured Jatrophihabitans sp.]|uniref:SRPBCC family protein n=1 Tax=uncultured Jatrophihabitans sp. TaxID=1610747 RepID=UPI0035CA6F2E
MTCFESTVKSEADISASREQVWRALTDPQLLPRLTPLLSKIDVSGDQWRWHMARIAALGVSVIPVFTETMSFDDGKRIEYRHTPPNGKRERAGADGVYELSDVDGGTHLLIELTLRVELPLPEKSKRAVQHIMKSTMNRTGDRFSENLLEHLDAREL